MSATKTIKMAEYKAAVDCWANAKKTAFAAQTEAAAAKFYAAERAMNAAEDALRAA